MSAATVIKAEKYSIGAIQLRLGETYHQAGFLGALIMAPIRIALLPVSGQAGVKFPALRAGIGSALSEAVVSRVCYDRAAKRSP